jgi:hypothetical protein
MPKPFKGEIKLDIRDSTPDWDAFLPDNAPEGAPNVLVVLYDDTGCAAWSPSAAPSRCRPCSGWPTTASPTRSGTRQRSARRHVRSS